MTLPFLPSPLRGSKNSFRKFQFNIGEKNYSTFDYRNYAETIRRMRSILKFLLRANPRAGSRVVYLVQGDKKLALRVLTQASP